MSKIMLVEDDRSLMEIYGIRLRAEGYEVVSANDGEEALAMAVKERPDLVLSDVMMPKISGFDMLDILRQTPETKGMKVIMMTALSSEDQRRRGEELGADRYLVKSQVGIEDVVKAIHEILKDEAPGTASAGAEAQQGSNGDNVATVPPVAAAPTGIATQPASAEGASPTGVTGTALSPVANVVVADETKTVAAPTAAMTTPVTTAAVAPVAPTNPPIAAAGTGGVANVGSTAAQT